MRRGDVYWVVLDPVAGSEIGRRRPAVVVQNDLANHSSPTGGAALEARKVLVPAESRNLGRRESWASGDHRLIASFLFRWRTSAAATPSLQRRRARRPRSAI